MFEGGICFRRTCQESICKEALIMRVNEIISSIVCSLAMFSYLYLSKCCLNDKAFLLGYCADLTVRTNVFASYTRYHLHLLP